MLTPSQLQTRYRQGHNITALLREEAGTGHNTEHIIETAYDLQTGSYIAAMADPAMAEHKADYAQAIASLIESLGGCRSLLEAGIGEGTTLSGVVQRLRSPAAVYGFDLSWSRVAFARDWLANKSVANVTLCTGSLLNIPLASDSVDVAFTSHAVEPNGGNEKPILQELYRVAREYVVLLEPGYELASPEARCRMEQHGYCRNLKGVAEGLGYQAIKHELFPHTVNPLNPTALTLIRKGTKASLPAAVLACPRFKTPLKHMGEMLYSPEALCVYPVLCGIPCLRLENAIIASKYPEVLENLRHGAAHA
jgi:ubiquinone/menaquinone biosynthesis C-methylase UbiE